MTSHRIRVDERSRLPGRRPIAATQGHRPLESRRWILAGHSRLGLPKSTKFMIKLHFAATYAIVDCSIAKHGLPSHPGSHRPTGQRPSIPRAPSRFCFLFVVSDHNVVATIIKLEPRHPWRQLEQQRSERAIRLPQQERPRQPEQQPGLPLHEFRQQPSLRTDLDLSD